MKRIMVVLAGMAMWVGAAGAAAQTATAGANASVTIPTVIGIDVTNTTVAFDAVTAASYDASTGLGSVAGTASSVVSTRSNILHRVTIGADAAFMTGPNDTKPSTHLEWRNVTLGGAFAGLTTTAADVVTGLNPGVQNPAAEVAYQMLLDISTDEVGTHTLAFTYTALAN